MTPPVTPATVTRLQLEALRVEQIKMVSVELWETETSYVRWTP